MSRLLRDLTPGQWALRSMVVAGLLVALLATTLVGTAPAWWLVALVAGLAVGYAALPETSLGTVAMGVVLAWWGIGLRDGLHPAALVAAAGLLVAHVAGVLVAYGPDRMVVDRDTVVLWVRRGATVFVLAPVVHLVAVAVRDQPEPPGLWVAGLGTALAAIAVTAVGLASGKVGE